MKKIVAFIFAILLFVGCTACAKQSPPAFYPTLDLYQLNDELIMDFDKAKKDYENEYFEIFVRIDYLIEKSQSFRATPVYNGYIEHMERANAKILGTVQNDVDFYTLQTSKETTFIIRGKITDISYNRDIYIQMDIYEVVEW